MVFTISIPRNATAQYQLLANANSQDCQIQELSQSWFASIDNVYDASKRVDDVFRYMLTMPLQPNNSPRPNRLLPSGIGNFNDQNISNSHNSKIVLVLESPHIQEYLSNPYAPAQGSTGTHIEDYILTIIANVSLNGSLLSGSYDLIICNPVQYQASLYCIHQKKLTASGTSRLRDRAWDAIYSYEQSNFFDRLTDYDPVVVINACTANLKTFVTEQLCRWKCSSVSGAEIYIADTHPCVWTSNTRLTHHIC